LEVISIEQANSDQDLFWTREAGLFCAYFRTLQEETGRLVPPRKAFTPTLARPLLPYLSILEVKSPELLLVRLVGTAIVNRTHFDNTGGNITVTFVAAESTKEITWSANWSNEGTGRMKYWSEATRIRSIGNSFRPLATRLRRLPAGGG